MRFNPPPNWPAAPSTSWTPPPGWQPDPSWGPPPYGWPLWIQDNAPSGAGSAGNAVRKGSDGGHRVNRRTLTIVGIIVAVLVVLLSAAGIDAAVRNSNGQDKVAAGPAVHLIEATAPTSPPSRIRPIAKPSRKTAAVPVRTAPGPKHATKSAAPIRTKAAVTAKPPMTVKVLTSRPVTTKAAVHTTRTPAAPTTTATRPSPPVTTAAPVVNLCGAPKNPDGYTFCGGQLIFTPAADVCDYFDCIASFDNGVGYMEECNDGAFSMSGGRRGACSSHGGEQRPVYH